MSTPTIISRRGVEVVLELDDDTTRTVVMYPVSVRMLLRLRAWAGAFAEAIMSFLGNDPREIAGHQEEQEFFEPVQPHPDDGERLAPAARSMPKHVRTQVNPLPPGQHEAILARKTAGVEGVLDLLLDEKNLKTVAALVADSCRDDEDITEESVMETDASVLFQLVSGWVEANKGIFDPLLGRLQEAMGGAQMTLLDEEDAEEGVPQAG